MVPMSVQIQDFTARNRSPRPFYRFGTGFGDDREQFLFCRVKSSLTWQSTALMELTSYDTDAPARRMLQRGIDSVN